MLPFSYTIRKNYKILKMWVLSLVNIGGPPPHHWVLIDRLIQQIVLQKERENNEATDEFDDPDHVVVPDIHVDELVKK